MNESIEDHISEIMAGVGPPLAALQGKEVLITGGAGFLGSWFVAVIHYMNEHVFEEPCKVFVMDSGIASDKNNALMNVESEHILWRQDDISTAKLRGSVDYIIHAAGIASPIYYRKFPIETIDGMVLGLSRLLKFAVENPVTSFLSFSSSEIYGNPHHRSVPIREDYNGNVSCTGPRSCYDESKRMGEAMCVAYQKIHNVPVKWVRPFNVYGPGMRIKDDRVVPKFMFQMLRGNPVTIHTPGTQTRTFCYITDAMIGFFKVLLIGHDGEVYNIGNNEPEISVGDLAHKMHRMFPTKSKIEEVEMPEEYPQDQAQRRCPDVSKAKEHMDYVAMVDIDMGLGRTWDWCKEELKHAES